MSQFEKENIDQVLEAIGVWGQWQSKMFYIFGVTIIPGCFQILCLTFVNANQVFQCLFLSFLSLDWVS